MAYDFPNTPTLGQTYQGYTWDGEKWGVTFNAPNQGGVIAIRVFTASGTYTPSPNMTTCVVQCKGGGGSGGGSAVTPNGGGGGEGCTAFKTLTAAQVGTSQVVTIGAGGVPAVAGVNAPGSVGGTTSLGSLCSAGGGGAGSQANFGGGGGSGGVTFTGDYSIPGAVGQFGADKNGGGSGWAAAGGGAGGGVNGTAGNANSGGGGGCGNSAVASGAGGSGLVVITEYGLTSLGSSTAASGAVRYDLPQGLTANQQAQGRSNIGALKKNYVINGAMMVSQENGTTAVGVGAYPVDQWSSQSNLATGVFNYAQVVSRSPAGSPNRLRLTVTTAQPTPGANIMLLTHRIEGLRVADLMWGTANAKTVTLQLGMKSPVAGNFPINMFNNGETAAVSGAVTIAAGEVGVDVVKTMTIAGPTSGTGWNTDNNSGMEIAIYMVNGGNANVFSTNGNVFELFDVSLTEGTTAPPFVVPDYASELAACMRYWYCTNAGFPKGAAIGTAAFIAISSVIIAGSVKFGTRMRTTPSMTLWSNGVQNTVRRTTDGASPALTGLSIVAAPDYVSAITASSGGLTPAGVTFDFDLQANARL